MERQTLGVMLKPMPQILRKRMEACNMRQCDLCERTGIPKSTISRYLSGAYYPKREHGQKLADALGITTDELYADNLPQTPHPAAPLRIWHVDLLPYLPDGLFRQQEQALLTVMRAVRDGGLKGNSLVDYVRNRPRAELYSYFLEYAKQNADRYGNLVGNRDEWIAFSDHNYVRRPFADWHCYDELRLNMAVLLDWFVYDRGPSKITAEDWCRLMDGYANITGEEYKV